MPSNDPSKIKKFEHGIMNSVYGTPVTQDDSRFIQKTEPTTTNVTTHHNVAPRFFSPPARPPVQLQLVEYSTNNNENNNTEKKASLKAQIVAGTLLGLLRQLPALLECVLPKNYIHVPIYEETRHAFERYSVFNLCVATPIIEEQIYRKYLPRWMNYGFKKIGFSPDEAKLSAMVLSNLLFTVLHEDHWVAHFIAGMCFSLVNKYYEESQVSNTVAHIVGNYLVCLAHRRVLSIASSGIENTMK